MELLKTELKNLKYTDKNLGNITDSEHQFKYSVNEEKSFISENGIIMEANEKLIFKIERLVRNSIEYRNFIKTLKYEFDLTSCKFFKNLDINDQSISLEFHHYPFNLFEIVSIVMMDKIGKKDTDFDEYAKIYNPYIIAEEVTRLHYESKIGLVPLSKTVHDLYHSGELFIPVDKDYVYGNYKDFMKQYKFSISDALTEKFNSLVTKTENIKNGTDKLDLNNLEINISNLIMTDVEDIKKIEIKNSQIA